jgi:hypothetical protein
MVTNSVIRGHFWNILSKNKLGSHCYRDVYQDNLSTFNHWTTVCGPKYIRCKSLLTYHLLTKILHELLLGVYAEVGHGLFLVRRFSLSLHDNHLFNSNLYAFCRWKRNAIAVLSHFQISPHTQSKNITTSYKSETVQFVTQVQERTLVHTFLVLAKSLAIFSWGGALIMESYTPGSYRVGNIVV